MPRPSQRAARREQLIVAFEALLAESGYEGATITRLAAKAGLSPGLVHHNFRNKEELIDELLQHLVAKLRNRLRDAHPHPGENPRQALSRTLLATGPASDPQSAKAWVGIFAESLRRPHLRQGVNRALGRLHRALRHATKGEAQNETQGDDLALALLALTTGFLVLGALNPDLTEGKAADIARRLQLHNDERPAKTGEPPF